MTTAFLLLANEWLFEQRRQRAAKENEMSQATNYRVDSSIYVQVQTRWGSIVIADEEDGTSVCVSGKSLARLGQIINDLADGRQVATEENLEVHEISRNLRMVKSDDTATVEIQELDGSGRPFKYVTLDKSEDRAVAALSIGGQK